MILVTGGPGFLGSWVLPGLCDLGPEIALVPAGEIWREPTRTLIDDGGARLLSEPSWWSARGARALAESVGPVTTLVHLGYVPPAGGGDALSHEREVNVAGSARLVETLRPEHVVFASSAQVYGASAAHGRPVLETAPLQPLSPYGTAKAEAEDSLRDVCKALRCSLTTLRLATLFGPGELVGRAVPNFIRAALAGTPAQIRGPGGEVGDYLYAGDAGRAVVAAATSARSGTFNIGSGEGLSTNEVHRRVNDAVTTLTGAAAIPAERTDHPQRPDFVLDVRAARDALLLAEPTPFGLGLAEEIGWFRRRS